MSIQKNDIPCLDGKMKVWHFDSDLMPARFSIPQWPQDYSLVAALETDCLDEAFVWTNDDDCWQRDEIHVFEPFGWSDDSKLMFFQPRSTTVGDVFVDKSGYVFMVENTGFRCIGIST